MFFTVKHGGEYNTELCRVTSEHYNYAADEEALFNPDCSLKLLVDSIKKRCNFPGGLHYNIIIIIICY